jgi:hypothetical protein
MSQKADDSEGSISGDISNPSRALTVHPAELVVDLVFIFAFTIICGLFIGNPAPDINPGIVERGYVLSSIQTTAQISGTMAAFLLAVSAYLFRGRLNPHTTLRQTIYENADLFMVAIASAVLFAETFLLVEDSFRLADSGITASEISQIAGSTVENMRLAFILITLGLILAVALKGREFVSSITKASKKEEIKPRG